MEKEKEENIWRRKIFGQRRRRRTEEEKRKIVGEGKLMLSQLDAHQPSDQPPN